MGTAQATQSLSHYLVLNFLIDIDINTSIDRYRHLPCSGSLVQSWELQNLLLEVWHYSNKYPKMWEWLWNWIMSRNLKNLGEHDIKTFNWLEYTLNRSMDLEDTASDGSEESERNVMRNFRKWVLIVHWQITLKLFAAVVWKIVFVTGGFGHWANISKQSVKRVAWFTLDAYNKMKVEKEKLRQESIYIKA